MQTQPITDETRRNELLAIRCQLGEREAFDELVHTWHQPLWKYLRGLIADPHALDESLQECWLRIVRAIPRLKDPRRLVPWMFSIARRTAMDQLRIRYRRAEEVEIDPESLQSADDGAFDEDVDLLEVGLSRLSPLDREVLTLFYLRTLSLNEVADVLDVAVGTVKSRLFRARQALREQLHHEENEQ